MACGSSKFGRPVIISFIVFSLISVSFCLLCGCGQSPGQKQKEYKAEWTDVMNEYEERVAADDKKAQKLISEEDNAGVIKLLDERIDYVWSVYDAIVVLDPPSEYRELHALTLYYLASVVAQLEAQSDLNEAVLEGKPTDDLKTIAEQAAQKTQYAISELALEVEKQGIELESMKKKSEPKVQESQEQGTVPSEDK